MPTHSEKKKTEFALSSAAENVALAIALGSGDEGNELSGMGLVESLVLADGYLSSIRYLNLRPPNYSASRHGDALDIIYNYTDAALRSEFRMNRNAFWKPGQLFQERGGNTWNQGISPGYEPRPIHVPTDSSSSTCAQRQWKQHETAPNTCGFGQRIYDELC